MWLPGHMRLLKIVPSLFSRMERLTLKPPNILVIVNDTVSSGRSYDMCKMIEDELNLCLGFERYTIYSLPVSHVTTQPWKDHCALLVATDDSNDLGSDGVGVVLTYIKEGGKCLSMSHKINATIDYERHSQIAETREDVLEVDNGSNETFAVVPIPFLEDISCQTAKLEWSGRKDFTVSPKTDKRPDSDTTQPCVSVLSMDNEARCILSPVELLVPQFHVSDMAAIARLKQTSEVRHGFLRELFTGLGLECGSPIVPELTYLYLMCSSNKVSQ